MKKYLILIAISAIASATMFAITFGKSTKTLTFTTGETYTAIPLNYENCN